MLGPLIVSFDHATRDGVVEGSLALSDLDGVEVEVGDTMGVMDSGAGPYEAEVIEVDGDRVRVRAPALSAPRSNPGLANADDFEEWSDVPAARTELSELIRDLLVETPRVTDLTIRTGRGVDFPGWDALVDGGSGAPYVPPGKSAWEMGTGSDPRRKAQQDYRKRTEEPLGVDPAETTFVFVTPRRWVGKHEWSRSKRDEGVWRGVRVLDADDLEGWLRCCRPAHLRFSERLGLRPREIKTLRLWWDRWSESTTPPLPLDLLLAGRDIQVDELRDRLSGTASAIGLKAGSRQEATAFAAAVLHTSEDTDHLSRSFVVASAMAWDNSVSTQGRSVLIPTFDRADVVAAVSAGHHVVVPMGVDDPGQAISLPRIGRSEARAAFENIGIESHRAEHLAVRARRSLKSLRRALSVDPRTARPAWAQGEDGDILTVLVLVGAWSDNREPDQEVVSEIVNRDYESVERLLRKWENTGDPPFRRSGNSWRLSNPEDAWVLLNDLVVGADLERWGKVILRVLGTRDPVLDMDPKDRFMASVRGEEQRWSFDLRRGLAQGLALLASLGSPSAIYCQNGSDQPDLLIKELLARAGKDDTGKLWQQLSGVLPLLAEAAPEEFLGAVRRDSVGEEPLIRNMFTDNSDLGSPWNETSAHTGLLWALETLCWSPDHLFEALDSLMHLAKIDPGGRLANRPIASATDVLLPWRPQTGAALDRRLEILGGVLRRHEHVGQDMVAGLLSRNGMSLNTRRPRFRDWVSNPQPVNSEDFERSIKQITDRALALIRGSPTDLAAWIDRLPDMFVEAQQSVVQCIQSLDQERLEHDDQFVIWEALTELLNRFEDDIILERRLFPDGLQILKGLTAELKTETPVSASAFQVAEATPLFGWDPAPEGAREAAVRSAYESGGLNALLKLTDGSDFTASVGIAAASALDDSILLDLLDLMSTSECDRELAMSWIRRRAEIRGIDWVKEKSDRIEHLRDDISALFFRSVSPDARLWELLDLQPRSVREVYWQNVNDFVIPAHDITIYVSYLLENDRPRLALRTVTFGLEDGSTPPVSIDTIEEILRKLLASRSERVMNSSQAVRIGGLLKVLESEKPDSRILLAAELALYRALPLARISSSAVHRMLQSDPSSYVDLVCSLVSPPSSIDETLPVSRDVAWSVVHNWKTPPGTDPRTGLLSYSALRSWVVKARQLFEERVQSEIGDLYIGELLSGSKAGLDGVWPAAEVRGLLEELGNDKLEMGLMRGAIDNRGEIVRDPYEGGKQERDLAERYMGWSRRMEVDWPATSRLHRKLAESYLRDAVREDERAERLGDLD